MPNLPILPPRPADLGGTNTVLRLFFDGICPLFLNQPAGRATFAMPRVADHHTRLVFDPYGTPVFLSLEGHFEISVQRFTNGPATLTTYDAPEDDRAFSRIVDIESQLHGAALPINREAVRASLKITEGTIYSAKLTERAVTFVQKGDPSLTPVFEGRVAKIIGVEIPVSAGDIVSIVRNGESGTPWLSFEIESGQTPEILMGNMCEHQTMGRLLNSGVTDDFELVYELVDGKPDRIVPKPDFVRLGAETGGAIECFAPRFGMTSDLPD